NAKDSASARHRELSVGKDHNSVHACEACHSVRRRSTNVCVRTPLLTFRPHSLMTRGDSDDIIAACASASPNKDALNAIMNCSQLNAKQLQTKQRQHGALPH